ncbi:MAG: glycosyltransferase family 2 protein [Aeromicrobium sp.]
MSSRSRTATSPLRDLALHIGKSSLTVADECMRFRLEESSDLLALMASKGEMDHKGVLEMVHDVVEGRISVPTARAALDPYALSSLARLMAGLAIPTGDFAGAAIISRAVRMIKGSVRLSRDAPRIDGQTNIAVGQFDAVADLLDGELDPDSRWILRAEYEHPAHGRPGATHDAWLAAFNQVFVDQGLVPVRISDGPGAPFDRLAVDVPDSLVVEDPDAPLVTVIMSTFRPDQSFPTAVASLLAQTWRNLEILIVDDCSPPEFDELLESVAASDPRIRLLRMPENGGTYRIRNHAIAQSRGSFIAFQDSDDWAHPERIARQVDPMLGRTGLVATSARALRVHGDLTSLRIGSNSFRRGEASLMFRKEVVIDALGGFDEVRKSADTEFFERLTVVFGPDAFLYITKVLVMTQLTEGSLSRDELKFGWHHGARSLYAESRRYWHREIAARREGARLEPGAPRRIPAPSRILTGRDPDPSTCDVLVVSDWREEIGRYEGASSLIDALASAGFTTVVAQATAARHSHRDRVPIADDILRLEANGITRFTVWTDPCHARLLLVTDPEILALTRPPDTVGLTADRLVVAAGHPPPAPEGGWLTYDPASLERNATRMFGSDIAWLPANQGIADDLQAAGATTEILPPRQLRIAPAALPRPYTGLRGGSRLIVGTTAIERPGRDRPSWASLQRLLPQDDDYDVRLRADPEIVRAVLKRRPIPSGWLVMDETTPMRGFLRQLDVFVAVPSRSWGPDLPWSVIATLAEGAVVVIDPAYQAHLRGAAVYASAVDVREALKALAADPDRVAEQRERGYEFCREVLSAEATVNVVRDLARLREDDR